MIVLDLPPPVSVNRTRRINWRLSSRHKGWTKAADALVLASRARSVNPMPRKVDGQFEVTIIFSEHHNRMDLDNGVKWVIDYLRRIEVVKDDSPKYMRRVVIEWGVALEGCRVVVKPWENGRLVQGEFAAPMTSISA
jgi:Holliday junction resolvase RusA-like endonuclease